MASCKGAATLGKPASRHVIYHPVFPSLTVGNTGSVCRAVTWIPVYWEEAGDAGYQIAQGTSARADFNTCINYGEHSVHPFPNTAERTTHPLRKHLRLFTDPNSAPSYMHRVFWYIWTHTHPPTHITKKQ